MLYIIEMLITLLYLPFKFESLNIFLHKWIAYLYFYECQVSCGFNGMEMSYWYIHHIITSPRITSLRSPSKTKIPSPSTHVHTSLR